MQVPGKEVERWGLAVNAWAGFSSRGTTKWPSTNGTLDAPAYQHILQKTLLPAAQEWYEDEQGRLGHCNRTRRLVHTAKSTEGWLEQHGVAVVDRVAH